EGKLQVPFGVPVLGTCFEGLDVVRDGAVPLRSIERQIAELVVRAGPNLRILALGRALESRSRPLAIVLGKEHQATIEAQLRSLATALDRRIERGLGGFEIA